ncbi:hypothetical protein TURU_000067 [Turdus rufiventris]|nr:hypothetical protein TURU_000067 [Turdus rufiventris]
MCDFASGLLPGIKGARHASEEQSPEPPVDHAVTLPAPGNADKEEENIRKSPMITIGAQYPELRPALDGEPEGLRTPLMFPLDNMEEEECSFVLRQSWDFRPHGVRRKIVLACGQGGGHVGRVLFRS